VVESTAHPFPSQAFPLSWVAIWVAKGAFSSGNLLIFYRIHRAKLAAAAHAIPTKILCDNSRRFVHKRVADEGSHHNAHCDDERHCRMHRLLSKHCISRTRNDEWQGARQQIDSFNHNRQDRPEPHGWIRLAAGLASNWRGSVLSNSTQEFEVL
jgi:hypothetical protein